MPIRSDSIIAGQILFLFVKNGIVFIRYFWTGLQMLQFCLCSFVGGVQVEHHARGCRSLLDFGGGAIVRSAASR